MKLPRRQRAEPIGNLELSELGPELSQEEVSFISQRMWARSGKSQPSTKLLAKCQAYVGEAPPPEAWTGKAVFHSGANPRSFQSGYSPTVTKNPRMTVRLPNGRIHHLSPQGYERLMGVRPDMTKFALSEKGKSYIVDDDKRVDMCGDGVCAPLTEWVGQTIRKAFYP